MSVTSRMDKTVTMSGKSGLVAELNENRSLRRFECGGVSLLLFPGNELEGGLTNLYLRRHRGQDTAGSPVAGSEPLSWAALLGPRGALVDAGPQGTAWVARGVWQGLRCELSLQLGDQQPVWFWILTLQNTTGQAQLVDLTYVQDLALAPYGAARNNEYYCSQYIDHTPLTSPSQGYLIGSRQNQAVGTQFPWTLMGSLRRAVAYSTDALQFHGLTGRSGESAPALRGELTAQRLQHEHSMVVLRDQTLSIAPGQSARAGFFGSFRANHPEATSEGDLSALAEILSQPGAMLFARDPRTQPEALAASPEATSTVEHRVPPVASLFSHAPLLDSQTADDAALVELFPGPWRHEERDASGQLLSFFHAENAHVVMHAKERAVLRPHGQLLRTGLHRTPSESALTSTVWMAGVFHSMVAQGHVNLNRFLSTQRSYLGLFRSHGQRVFVEEQGRWQLLQLPSCFEMTPQVCRWIYRHSGGVIEVRATATHEPQRLGLSLRILKGSPARFLITHHVAFSGDDGAAGGAVQWRREGSLIRVTPAPGSEVARRFPQGSFCIEVSGDTRLEQIGGDELLFLDGVSRNQSYLCMITAPCAGIGLQLRGDLILQETQSPLYAAAERDLIPQLRIDVPAAADAALGAAATRLAEMAPWLAQNAWVHYLSPRGLEQFSGGGWGTRDVCQGPVELLLALGDTAPVRDVLLRVMRAQNPDGDWPQWFMMFERERNIRAGDSHGDVVLWPLVVVAQYLQASGDASVLDEQVPFFDAAGPQAGELATVWTHVERALGVLERRTVPGAMLAAYGHGDWNDSLQPADPRLREHMCSAWTVTLQVQALRELAAALNHVGRDAARAAQLAARADAVQADFQRLLIADEVLTGYAVVESDGSWRYLLHPRDELTGVQYSALGMIHAILEDLFTPAQGAAHLELIETHLSGPDGARLFDRPMPYHGGPQRIFQRAESATFFGREIGLMYTHAHLRYAQALAHIGETERFFRALCQAVPIGIQSLVARADRRQANCYFSSSDAAFADRYQAREDYERVRRDDIGLDGGWRVYSSGAGISLSLILRRFLGIEPRDGTLRLDPVIPPALDGSSVRLFVWGQPCEVSYRIGPRGCGVRAVRVGGAALPMTRESNPHRPGGVLIAREQLQSSRGETLRLEIELG